MKRLHSYPTTNNPTTHVNLDEARAMDPPARELYLAFAVKTWRRIQP